MKCPYCGYKESKVIDSRPAEEGSSIRRRRECLSCAKRFTTYETVESLPMVVIKKDGSRQSFDKRKVLNGMIRACEKRPVPFEVLEQKADEIEQTLQNSLEREVSTEYIGELVMDKLRAVDETITMMREPEHQFVWYSDMVTGYDLGSQYIWDVYAQATTPAEKAESMRGTWQAYIDEANAN